MLNSIKFSHLPNLTFLRNISYLNDGIHYSEYDMEISRSLIKPRLEQHLEKTLLNTRNTVGIPNIGFKINVSIEEE